MNLPTIRPCSVLTSKGGLAVSLSFRIHLEFFCDSFVILLGFFWDSFRNELTFYKTLLCTIVDGGPGVMAKIFGVFVQKPALS